MGSTEDVWAQSGQGLAHLGTGPLPSGSRQTALRPRDIGRPASFPLTACPGRLSTRHCPGGAAGGRLQTWAQRCQEGLGQPTETWPAPADVRMAPGTLEAPGSGLAPRRGCSVGVGA